MGTRGSKSRDFACQSSEVDTQESFPGRTYRGYT